MSFDEPNSECIFCKAPVYDPYKDGVYDLGWDCDNCGSHQGSGWGGNRPPRIDPWKTEYENASKSEAERREPIEDLLAERNPGIDIDALKRSMRGSS